MIHLRERIAIGDEIVTVATWLPRCRVLAGLNPRDRTILEGRPWKGDPSSLELMILVYGGIHGQRCWAHLRDKIGQNLETCGRSCFPQLRWMLQMYHLRDAFWVMLLAIVPCFAYWGGR